MAVKRYFHDFNWTLDHGTAGTIPGDGEQAPVPGERVVLDDNDSVAATVTVISVEPPNERGYVSFAFDPDTVEYNAYNSCRCGAVRILASETNAPPVVCNVCHATVTWRWEARPDVDKKIEAVLWHGRRVAALASLIALPNRETMIDERDITAAVRDFRFAASELGDSDAAWLLAHMEDPDESSTIQS